MNTGVPVSHSKWEFSRKFNPSSNLGVNTDQLSSLSFLGHTLFMYILYIIFIERYILMGGGVVFEALYIDKRIYFQRLLSPDLKNCTTVLNEPKHLSY